MITLNKQEVVFGQFPNKELNLPFKGHKIRAHNRIQWLHEDATDFFKLAALKEWLDSTYKTSELYIEYMPYSRMDRANADYHMTLHTACQLINNMEFFAVTIREPHSDVTPALIKNSIVHHWCAEHRVEALAGAGADSYMFPDAGAQKRYNFTGYPTVVGMKTRDFATGNIESLQLVGKPTKNVLDVATCIRVEKVCGKRFN